MKMQDPKYFWSDLRKEVRACLGLCYFFYLIISDAWGARKKKAHWISGYAFILSAFTIQLLSYLATMPGSHSDEPGTWKVAKLIGDNLLIDSGRLIICVFMAYLLPGMALSGSASSWGDIASLGIDLLADIASELSFLYSYSNQLIEGHDFDYPFEHDVAMQLKNQPSLRGWYIASSWGTFVSVVLLILFLGSAVSTGNTIRSILTQRITAALPARKIQDISEFEGEVFKSWLLARACRPEYVVARSQLSSAVGMLVTLRIVFSLVKFDFLKHKGINQYDDGLDALRLINFILQCIFVIVGWIVICWRWMTAVVYFSIPHKKRSVFSVEDFWTRDIREKKYSFIRYTKNDRFSRYVVSVIEFILLGLQFSLVFFSKICWYLSEIVISNRFIRGCLLGSQNLLFYSSEDARYDLSEFDKHREVLERVRMPQERAANLWVANKKFIKQTKDRIKSGYKKGRDCKELIDLVAQRCRSEDYVDGTFVNQPEFISLPTVKQYFPSLEKTCWKMMAVSYFKIIVELYPSSERVDRAMKAFEQARDFMNFLDRMDIQGINTDRMSKVQGINTDRMSKVGDQEFETVKNSVSSCRNNPRVDEPFEVILEMQGEAKKLLRDKGLIEQDTPVGLRDSRNLAKIAPSYSLYRVCKGLLHGNGALHEQHRMEDLLDTTIASCVLQFTEELVICCREWAINLEEDKIWETVYMAGKVKGVLERANVWPNSIDPQPGENSAPVVPNIIDEATDT